MHIIKVGFNYKTAPVEIREKLTFSENNIEEAMKQLNLQKSILENVIVSTCNRTEIYAVVDQIHTGRYYIKQFLAEWFQVKKEQFTAFLQIAESDEAIEHLFRVSAGLDSMILGETQILGQVREAFFTAQQAYTTGTIFNELFKQAISFAKRAHKETAIGEHAVSVSYAAVQLARKIFGDLADKHVVINGAGKMGELAVKNLQGSGATQITVVNRTLENAEVLAGKFAANAEESSHLLKVIQHADILISSTGSASTILTKEALKPVQKKRKGKPLFLVDIAVPRDLDPKISELDNVFLYDIDDLQHVVDENLASRESAAESIEVLLDAEIVAFNEWVTTLGVVPVISALRHKALSIQSETMKSIERKIPDLTVREKKVLNKHTKSIINQLLKEPINQAKELAASENPEEALSLFVDILGINEEVKEELVKHEEKKDANKTNATKKLSSRLIRNLLTSN
ncbi:glutamyl-tRNA reductase [Virgibacillus alimentarius]|uniref:Glutamyl-tRNA reductase n=1 Tax=Virgibacillus alimentarius TaxID=698769 RepID=A0ABS4S591_9BACI|nr:MULTISPECIES: glutamyl-tRNA reductase [Virgibacillus]MBP2256660.1 glutamyl-tRNA reductase [Virgibacillus alimentarius]HLR67122.1 glutamyl-tRNA reductase [Virgibacillus sp.]